MLRVNWQGEADKARTESLAIQAANRHHQQPELVSDLEEALTAESDGEPERPSTPGKLSAHATRCQLQCVRLTLFHSGCAKACKSELRLEPIAADNTSLHLSSM